jgi:hypothetical protein
VQGFQHGNLKMHIHEGKPDSPFTCAGLYNTPNCTNTKKKKQFQRKYCPPQKTAHTRRKNEFKDTKKTKFSSYLCSVSAHTNIMHKHEGKIKKKKPCY